MGKIEFQPGNYYHIYNRGANKLPIFADENDYLRFITALREFNAMDPVGSLWLVKRKQGMVSRPGPGLLDRLTSIIAYCLNPNHYHLLVREEKEQGISSFIQRLGTGYTRYFNERHKRQGVLFQGSFRAVLVSSDRQLLYAAAYVNCNAEIHGIARGADWPWCSQPDYLGLRQGTIADKAVISGQFRNNEEYEAYCREAINNAGQMKETIRSMEFQ